MAKPQKAVKAKPTKTTKARKTVKPRPRKSLTAKQEAFAAHYAQNGNAPEAYIASFDTSKMSPSSIRSAASRLLDNESITQRVHALREPATKAIQQEIAIEALDLAKRMYAFARLDPARLVRTTTRKVTKTTPNGDVLTYEEPVTELIPLEEVPPELREVAPYEMLTTTTGKRVPVIRISMADRIRAVNDLHKMMGFEPPKKIEVKAERSPEMQELIDYLCDDDAE